MTPNPLQEHRSVFLLFVSVVLEDLSQVVVMGNVHTLPVPVDRFQFLHKRLNGASHVLRFRLQLLVGCVPCNGHCLAPSSSVTGHLRSVTCPSLERESPLITDH